jgi:hypothetical protein
MKKAPAGGQGLEVLQATSPFAYRVFDHKLP